MSLMMLLAASGHKAAYVPTPHTKTFTGNASFPMPAGVSLLDSIVGHGGPGQPAQPGTDYYYTRVYTRYYRRDGGPADVVDENADGWGVGTGNGYDYCDPPQDLPDSTVYYQQLTCYYYRVAFGQGATPATTGASATGFGKVFPGGTGGPATDVTFTNVPVTANANYSVVVPPGGSITINYKA